MGYINILAGFSCSVLSLTLCVQQVQKPNVIVIMADDIGYRDLSCYGEKTIHTLNVEKLSFPVSGNK